MFKNIDDSYFVHESSDASSKNQKKMTSSICIPILVVDLGNVYLTTKTISHPRSSQKVCI